MSILEITSINHEGLYRRFLCQVPSIEIAIDSLNLLVKNGNELLTVNYSEDNGGSMPLSVDAIDGDPMRDIFKSLQQQWEEVLAK